MGTVDPCVGHSGTGSRHKRLHFEAFVQVSAVVEMWLGDVTSSMRGALQALVPAARAASGCDWDTQPSQVLGLAEELNFTKVRNQRSLIW